MYVETQSKHSQVYMQMQAGDPAAVTALGAVRHRGSSLIRIELYEIIAEIVPQTAAKPGGPCITIMTHARKSKV